MCLPLEPSSTDECYTEEFNIVRQKLANVLKIKTRNCPKCGSEVKPS